MEIRFNVTGAKRKELVQAFGQIVGWEPIYKGAPTFAYAIANFLVDKNGTLTGDITQEHLDALALQGFTSEFALTDEEAAEAAAPTGTEQQPGSEDWSEPATQENAPDEPGVPSDDISAYLPSGTDAPAVPETLETEMPNMLTIEMPKDGFTETTLANLEKLIESKAALIKNALGAESLPVTQNETTVGFPWFTLGTAPDEIDAYTHFIAALCKMAKEQVRVTAKPKEVENEKYAFRCFLLRLGLIGKEYAAARKILLSRLTGNGSFKSGERKPTVEAAVAPDGADTAAEAPTGAEDTQAADGADAALAEAVADAELIHAVNTSLEQGAATEEAGDE